MTIAQWIKTSLLAPRTAAILIKHIIARSTNLDAQSFVLAHANDVLTPHKIKKLDDAKKRVEKNEPLQYIVGYTEFRDLVLKTDSRALIPRPETEELVELIIAHLKENYSLPTTHYQLTITDIGTGTGAIALSLADWAIKNNMPIHIIATDVSADALELAQENYILCRMPYNSIAFRQGSLLAPIDHTESVDLIIANLPYIPTYKIDQLDKNVKDFEPHVALDGGPDGLDLIRRLLNDAPRILKPGGKIFLETWHNHSADDFKEFDQFTTEFRRDSYDHSRFAILTYKK